MFKILLKKMNLPVNNPVAFDPARLGDPVASKTAWTPVKKVK